VQGGVLGVHGHDLRASRFRERYHELASHDQRLLVGERQVDPLAERGYGRAETGGADERVQDQVRLGLHDEPHEPIGAREHLPVRPRLGGTRGHVLVGECDASHAVGPRLLEESLPRALCGEPHELELVACAADLECLPADRAGRAQDQQALGGG